MDTDRIASARVMVVGCGALGNEVLKNLVLMGVERFWIVDFDKVERHNLSRSVLFRLNDVQSGRYKAEVAAERLREYNPSVEAVPLVCDFCHGVGLGLIMDMDVLISCVDNRWTRYIINRKCMRAGKMWVDGGIYGLEGTARVFGYGRNCYACSLAPQSREQLRQRFSCATAIRRAEQNGSAFTTAIAASVTGAVQAQEALKILSPALGDGETSLAGKMFYYEGEKMSGRLVRFSAYDEDCPEHERWTPEEGRTYRIHASASGQLGGATLRLRDFAFVDRVEDKVSGEIFRPMLPDYRVEEYIKGNPRTSARLMSDFYQHSLTELDSGFPYPELDFRALGYAERDVVEIMEEGRIKYIKLI